ncbi:MAG: lysylphosphatidylglycerol synthase transmembrane domain-containing protein [Alphaproteobacteria bacterium]
MSTPGDDRAWPVRGGLRRAEVWLVGSLAAMIALATLAGGLAGGEAVLGYLARLDAGLLAGLLALSLVNYLARLLRWQLFARALGLHAVGLAEGGLYYVAGFAMGVTPGKIGEALRLWLLRRRAGYRYHRTSAMLVADRLTDMVAMLALCGVGLFAFPDFLWTALPLAVAVAALVAAIAWPAPMLRTIGALYGRVRRWPRLFAGLRRALRHARECITGPTLPLVLVLSLVGWLAEAVALWWLLAALGADVGLLAAIFVFAFATFAGVATMLPGGLGGVEAGMIGLLTLLHVDLATAIVVTVVIRVTTLWFAVGLGFLALPVALRRSATGNG